MELPIQLQFFKKLELYQQLRSQNQKALGRDRGWPIEKMILKETVFNPDHSHSDFQANIKLASDEDPRVVDLLQKMQ